VTTRVLLLLAALTLLAAVASGCGSSGSSGEGVATLDGAAADGGDDTQQNDETQDPEEAALAWARCMRKEGVNVPDPEVGDGGSITIRPGSGGGALRQGNREKFEAATKKCGTPFGDAEPPRLSDEDRQELQDTMLEFARCMRENGADVPDPDFSQGGGGFFRVGPGEGLDPEDSTFQKAQKACEHIMQGLRDRIGPPDGDGAAAGDES
jgi:hypothetical protein